MITGYKIPKWGETLSTKAEQGAGDNLFVSLGKYPFGAQLKGQTLIFNF